MVLRQFFSRHFKGKIQFYLKKHKNKKRPDMPMCEIKEILVALIIAAAAAAHTGCKAISSLNALFELVTAVLLC